MFLWFHKFGSPPHFYRIAGKWIPWLTALFLVLLVSGLYGGLVLAPPDYQQGDSYRIIFIHVPAAWMSMFVYVSMAVCGVVIIVWRMKLAEVVLICSAPIGASFTFLALATGSIWGKPMWGTWWAWDPRLTSFLILFLFYLGYIALWAAIEDPDTAADLTSILCLVGSVFALLSRYAVRFWNQGLHQGTSVPVATGGRTVDDTFFVPLAISRAGFVLLVLALVLYSAGTEIRTRRAAALLARAERLQARARILRGITAVNDETRLRIADRLRRLGG